MNKFKRELKDQAIYIFKDSMFLFVSFLVFFKSVLFMCVSSTVGAASIKYYGSFFSAPPYMTYLMFSIGVVSFSFLFKGRNHLKALIIINILATILIIGNLVYYRGFSNYLNFFMFSAAGNTSNIGLTILSLFRPIDSIFIIDIIFLIIYYCRNKKAYSGSKRNTLSFMILIILVIAYFPYAAYKIDNKKRAIAGQSLFVQSFAPYETMSNLGPIGYIIFDGYNYFNGTKTLELSEADKEKIETYYIENQENLPDNEYFGKLKGKNLLMIQVESLENFVIGNSIENQEITPNINKLLNNSIYFDNFNEEVYNGTSSDSDLIMTTSLFPIRKGYTFYRYPLNSYKGSLPMIANNNGYDTFSAHPSKASYWNYSVALKSIGYKTFKSSEDFDLSDSFGLGISDAAYFNQVKDFIYDLEEPFLAQAVSLSMHAPYTMRDEDKKLKITGSIKGTRVEDYLQAVHYTDEQIGKLISNMDREGILDRTAVVIYGDHTSLHKYYEDEVSSIKDLPEFVNNENKEVPLIIYSKNLEKEVKSVHGGQIDYVPTISYLLGFDKDEYKNSLGRNLLNTGRDATILADYSVIGNASKEEEEHLKDAIDISQLILQSDYFKYRE